jgi:hypothetical protein
MQLNKGLKDYHRDVLADWKIYSAIAIPNMENLQYHKDAITILNMENLQDHKDAIVISNTENLQGTEDATEQNQPIPLCNSCHDFVISKSTDLGKLCLSIKLCDDQKNNSIFSSDGPV